MRWLAIGVLGLTLAGCSKIPSGGPGDTVTDASGVAFTYAYTFRLPSDRISAAQEAHAAACERLGPARCRITGMTYRVDDGGEVGASLSVKLAGPIARAFGRQSVAGIEAAGGALAGAEIGGTDTAPAAKQAEHDRTDAVADQAAAKNADHPGAPAATRAAANDREAIAVQQARTAQAAAAAVRDSVAFTPMTFTYRAGSGVGLSARLGEAAHMAVASLVFTLWAVLSILAVLGPPAVLLVIALLLWRRFGWRWWQRLFPPRVPAEGRSLDCAPPPPPL